MSMARKSKTNYAFLLHVQHYMYMYDYHMNVIWYTHLLPLDSCTIGSEKTLQKCTQVFIIILPSYYMSSAQSHETTGRDSDSLMPRSLGMRLVMTITTHVYLDILQ